MTKVIYFLFFIMQNPTGADQIESIVHYDAGECEQQRQWLKSRNILVVNTCQRAEINYE